MYPNDIEDILSDISTSTDDENVSRLSIGDYTLTQDADTITIHGLGSCVGAFLYDPVTGIGGGTHTLLPTKDTGKTVGTDDSEKTRYTDEGIRVLYEELCEIEAVEEDRIVAKIVGGSDVLRMSGMTNDAGSSNVEQAKETLNELGVVIKATDIGGERGRIVEFDPTTGGVIIRDSGGSQRVI